MVLGDIFEFFRIISNVYYFRIISIISIEMWIKRIAKIRNKRRKERHEILPTSLQLCDYSRWLNVELQNDLQQIIIYA